MEFMKNIPAHLDKHCGAKDLLSLDSAYVRNLNTALGGCIPARYCKGVAGDGDNLVIVQFLLDKSPARTVNAERCTARTESRQLSAPVRTDMPTTTF